MKCIEPYITQLILGVITRQAKTLGTINNKRYMYQYLDYHDISTCKMFTVYRPKCPVSFLSKPDFSLVD